MFKLVAFALAIAGVAAGLGCGGGAAKKDPMAELKQLIVLYESARPKFVVQKQEMIQADSCDRATSVRQAADQLAADAAMSTENSETITKVQMEMQQAEKECLAK